MGSRAVLVVVFVTLSWGFMGTYAENTTTVAPGTMTTSGTNTSHGANMTTAAGHNMTDMTTAAGHNMTNMTTAAGHNMTNMTTAAGHNMTNMTTAAGHNMTDMTTAAGHNMTNMTTAAGHNMTNMTTAAGHNMTNMTTAAGHNMTDMTTAAATSQAPPLSPNTTVVLLERNISRTGCGTQQLCAAEPAACDPSQSSSCFFLAAKQQSGQNFEFELSGESDGYLAASLSTSGTQGVNETTYVCANSRGAIRFFGAFLNNGKLTETELPVNSVKGSVNERQIQCTFLATLPDVTTRAATTFSVSVSTGEFNATSETLGDPTARIRTGDLNLADANAVVVNELSSTTTTPFSRTGCGSQKLCAAEPSECDPSTSGSCFFFSSRQRSGQIFDFEFSGQSEGFIAASLSTDTTLGGNDTTYVCARNNTSVTFITGLLDNGTLSTPETNVNFQNGSINGSTIQCAFTVTVPNNTEAVSTRAAFFSIILSNGTFNTSDQTLGEFRTLLISAVVNLANPNATIINLLNANTTSSPTDHAVMHQQSLMQALLITLGVLFLTMLGGN